VARDYKKPRGGRKRETSSSPWRFLISGFSLGVIAAAIVYYLLSPGAPRRPDQPIPETRQPPASMRAEAPEAAPGPEPAVIMEEETPQEVAETEPEEEGFAFWKILPEYEVILPEEDDDVDERAVAKPLARISTPGKYLLQVGSFRRYEDADRLKARLALQGIECSIKRITLDDNQYHRVLIGPESELDQINALRERLTQQNIKPLVIRIPAQ
jgi:cell division protein FtsN